MYNNCNFTRTLRTVTGQKKTRCWSLKFRLYSGKKAIRTSVNTLTNCGVFYCIFLFFCMQTYRNAFLSTVFSQIFLFKYTCFSSEYSIFFKWFAFLYFTLLNYKIISSFFFSNETNLSENWNVLPSQILLPLPFFSLTCVKIRYWNYICL